MQLDLMLLMEVQALRGDGGRKSWIALLDRVEAARKDLSTTDVRRTFQDTLHKHGRAVVAVCVAATLMARADRLQKWGTVWAQGVLDQLQEWGSRDLLRLSALIDDGIHPTAICEYAQPLFRETIQS